MRTPLASTRPTTTRPGEQGQHVHRQRGLVDRRELLAAAGLGQAPAGSGFTAARGKTEARSARLSQLLLLLLRILLFIIIIIIILHPLDRAFARSCRPAVRVEAGDQPGRGRDGQQEQHHERDDVRSPTFTMAAGRKPETGRGLCAGFPGEPTPCPVQGVKHVDVLVRGAGVVRAEPARCRWPARPAGDLRPDEPRAGMTRPRPTLRALCAQRILGGAAEVAQGLRDAAGATPVGRHAWGDAEGACIAFSAWEQRSDGWPGSSMRRCSSASSARCASRRMCACVTRRRPITSRPIWVALMREAEASATRRSGRCLRTPPTTEHSAIAARLVASTPHQGTTRQWFARPTYWRCCPSDAPSRSVRMRWCGRCRAAAPS